MGLVGGGLFFMVCVWDDDCLLVCYVVSGMW